MNTGFGGVVLRYLSLYLLLLKVDDTFLILCLFKTIIFVVCV